MWQFSGSRISKSFPQQKNKQLESVMVYSRCSSSRPAAMQREALEMLFLQSCSNAERGSAAHHSTSRLCRWLTCSKASSATCLLCGPSRGPCISYTGLVERWQGSLYTGHWDWPWYSRRAGMWPCSVSCKAAWELKQLQKSCHDSHRPVRERPQLATLGVGHSDEGEGQSSSGFWLLLIGLWQCRKQTLI